MLPLLLSFTLLLQAAPVPPCKGVQCAIGCLPLGSVCPSTTEARLQGLIVDQGEAPPEPKPDASLGVELAPRRPRPDLASIEACEERRWMAYRRRLGIGLGLGIPASHMGVAGIWLMTFGFNAREGSRLLFGDVEDSFGMGTIAAGGALLGTGLVLGIAGLVASLNIEIPTCSVGGCSMRWRF